MTCPRCQGTEWVCEKHPDKPMEHLVEGVRCGGAGDPCPVCNPMALKTSSKNNFHVSEDQ